MREKKELNVQVGEQIRQARDRSALTQEQLAERIEVSPQYVSDLERGVVGVSLATLKRICVCLGVSADRLLFGEKNESRAELLARKCTNLTEEQFCLLMDMVRCFTEAIHSEHREPIL